VVGLGLSFKKSGLDLDRKIWQSAHLWSADRCSTTPWINLRFIFTAVQYCRFAARRLGITGVDCSPKDLLRHPFLRHSGHMAELTWWDLSIRGSGLTSRVLRILDMCSLSRTVTPRTLRKYLISVVCSFDSILSVVT